MVLQMTERLAAAAASPARRLDWRTWNCAVGTEYTTMSGQRLDQLLAPVALVEVRARIGWHDLILRVTAKRASER